jgi:hypothetical protein
MNSWQTVNILNRGHHGSILGMVILAKGDRYKCDDCGMVVLVEDACGCSACDLVCCDEPMKKVTKKAPAKKAAAKK